MPLGGTTVPPFPTPWVASAIFETQITGNSDPRGDGGDPILGSQIAYGPNASSPNHPDNTTTTLLGVDGSGTIGALTPPLVSKVTYYFWARFRNSIGYGAWSSRTSYRTKGIPGVSGAPFAAKDTKAQTSVTMRFNTTTDNGGDAIDSRTVGLSTNPLDTVPGFTLTIPADDDPAFVFSGMNPGGRYFFWSRTHNAHGDSAWSAKSTIDLIAGAHVTDGLVRKRAVPWVRTGGVWKVAMPWTRTVGFWNKVGD
jgi:hypothetical protein